MARKRRPKKPRGARGERMAQPDGTASEKAGVACDLMVTLGKDSTYFQKKLQVQEIMSRLSSTGFTHMALAHTIYGRPRPAEDQASRAIPSSLWTPEQVEKSAERPSKRRKESNTPVLSEKKWSPIKVLRRLHAVVENLSDVGSYLSNGPHGTLLNEYDIISVAPRNDTTFQTVCSSATSVDIITLDYSSTRGMKLPFKIRAADVKAAIGRGAAFEIHYAPAILQSKLRKALAQTSRELQSGALGKKPLVLFSSGDRTFEDHDVGTMALRLPGDLSNLMQVLLQFDPATSSRALGCAALEVLRRADERRFGKSDIVAVSMGGPNDEEAAPEKDVDGKQSVDAELDRRESSACEDGGIEDGFISMT